MKLLNALLFTALPAVSAAAVPDRISDFTLLDHQGKSHQLSYYFDADAIVIVVQANGSAVVRNAAPALQRVRNEFESRNVAFFMLNPVAADTRSTITREAARFGFDLPVLVDETGLVAQGLGVTRLGEVVVIESATRAITYRGAIADGDRLPLADALTGLLDGAAAAGTAPPSEGAEIDFAARPAAAPRDVSYTRDIVPILRDNCVNCHRDGAIGSWSMSSHAMVRGWSPMMREVVMTRRMPPGQIDPHVGKPIADVAGLSVDEQLALVRWIDAGSPIDGDADPLAELTFETPRFTLGEPDLVYQIPPQEIPATGVIDYRYIPVELNLDRDVWVRAMEFVPGDRQVLHHVIAYLSSPADRTVRGRATGAARGESVGGFAPGRQPDQFRDNSGRLIRKGSNLLLQMHYTTSGRATVDTTEIGIYLHDEPPAYVMSGGVAGQRRFLVPPGAKEYKLEGEQLIERDAYLYEMTPHMHFRGKYMSYTAEYPDGTSETLLSVPKYDFNWQFNYALREPLFLPAGTRLVARGAMDNSDRNPGNPDPSLPVHFGLQTKHEMFFGFTTLRYVGDTPESLTAGKAREQQTNVAGL